MLRGLHGLIFSDDPPATRKFLRDVLRLPSRDVGDGWLIFDVPAGELGVHPIAPEGGPPAGTHALSLWCDDLEATLRELRTRGAAPARPVTEQRWGFETVLAVPGGVEIQLFQPKYGAATPSRRPVRRPARARPHRRPRTRTLPASRRGR